MDWFVMQGKLSDVVLGDCQGEVMNFPWSRHFHNVVGFIERFKGVSARKETISNAENF